MSSGVRPASSWLPGETCETSEGVRSYCGDELFHAAAAIFGLLPFLLGAATAPASCTVTLCDCADDSRMRRASSSFQSPRDFWRSTIVLDGTPLTRAVPRMPCL